MLHIVKLCQEASKVHMISHFCPWGGLSARKTITSFQLEDISPYTIPVQMASSA